MQVTRSPSFPALVHFEPSRDSGPDSVLLHPPSAQLFVLNETARFVWEAYAAGSRLTEITHLLHEQFPDMQESALSRDVQGMVEQWRAIDRTTLAIDRPTEELPPRVIERRVDVDSRRYACGPYQLMDFTFSIQTDNKRAAAVAKTLFSHLTVEVEQAGFPLVVEQEDGIWRLSANGETFASGNDEALGTILHGATLLQSILHTEAFAAFHAAVVSRGANCILLPAISGAGKSTLAGYLASQGYGYVTDEVALLTNDFRIKPCPTNIGLKAGSWQVLSEYGYAIDQVPVWQREDGLEVKYLQPPNVQRGDQFKEVAAIVFTTYAPDSCTCLAPISPAQALQQLAQAGYDTAAISVQWVEDMLSWLEETPAYAMVFSNLDEARQQIEQLM